MKICPCKPYTPKRGALVEILGLLKVSANKLGNFAAFSRLNRTYVFVDQDFFGSFHGVELALHYLYDFTWALFNSETPC